MATFTALYDACVLYPQMVRDLLMRLALTDLFRAKWSRDIQEEWMGHLLERRTDLSRENLVRVRDLMNEHVRDAVVTGYEDLIPALSLPDEGDRHVLAAAIRSRAGVIVTYKLKHFPESELEKYGIEAQHPDEFVRHLVDLDPEAVLWAVRSMREALSRPPFSPEELVASLEGAELVETAGYLRGRLQLI